MCNYSYKASTPVGYVDIFYSDLEKRMKDEGLLPIDPFRGKLFKKEFIIDRNEYILFVEVSVVSNVDEWGVLTQIPYFTVSLKKRNWLGVEYKCVNFVNSTHLYYVDTIVLIVDRSASLSKKESFTEIIDIPLGEIK